MKQTVMYSFVIHKEKNGFFNFTKFVANIIDENSIAHIKLFRVECSVGVELIYAATMTQSAGLLPQITRLFTESNQQIVSLFQQGSI